MAIKIYCDLCGAEREITQVKGVESSGAGLALTAPSMASGHFVCEECLGKIGWSAGANLTQTDTDLTRTNTDGADGKVATREAGRKVQRRRGVAVLLTWKREGGFEVCNSIAAAVDRIAEKTGKVIQGADISHALLRELVFNAETFMVKYAEEQETMNTMNTTIAEKAQFELKGEAANAE